MDNLEDKMVRCLNPECGRDSCRMCKLSNHLPYSCKEYKEEVLDVSRRKVEEELTMSWVRQCSNCMVDFERTSGCNIMFYHHFALAKIHVALEPPRGSMLCRRPAVRLACSLVSNIRMLINT